MYIRKRRWIDLPCTLSKLQLSSPLFADSQVSSKWLPLLAVSPFSPTCWSSTSHFSLMNFQPSAPHLLLHSCSIFAGSWQCVCLGAVLDNAAHFPAPRKAADPQENCVWAEPCRAKSLGGNDICPGCSASGFLSQLWIPWDIFCRRISSDHRGYAASPSHLSCAWLDAHSQPGVVPS